MIIIPYKYFVVKLECVQIIYLGIGHARDNTLPSANTSTLTHIEQMQASKTKHALVLHDITFR